MAMPTMQVILLNDPDAPVPVLIEKQQFDPEQHEEFEPWNEAQQKRVREILERQQTKNKRPSHSSLASTTVEK